MYQTPMMKNAARGSMLWGFLVVILGIFAMMTPAVTGVAVTWMLAALMLVSGFGMVIYAFSSGTFGRGIMRFLFGGITVAAGLWMFGNPGMALGTLTLFLAGYFVVSGASWIIGALQLPANKGWAILNGIVTLMLGVLIWRGWPVSGAWAVGILFGIHLTFSGMTMMAMESVKGTVDKALDS